MLKNKAFTLTEILLALGILGIITGAVAMQLQKMEADSIKISFQNCYSQMTSILSEMYNDETLYPRVPTGAKDAEGKTQYLGFCNGYVNGVSKQAYTKFLENFTDKIANENNDISGAFATIDTKNNSYWYISGYMLYNSDCSNVNNAYINITFDTNGRNKGPNCPYSGSMSGSSFTSVTSNCPKPDTFLFKIKYDNSIEFDTNTYYNGTNLETYLKNNHYLDSNKTD